MWNISAGNVWFKLFAGSHKISADCNTEIPHKRSSISCMFVDLCITRLFLCQMNLSKYTSLGEDPMKYTFLSSVRVF